MGVYINMEMPESCDECPMNYDSIDCSLAEGISLRNKELEFLYEHERHKDCPLAPIPPHGRLIDASAFVQSIRDVIHYDASRGREYISAEDLQEALTNAPTIIPADPAEEEQT